ncbi:hypothetical protein [Sphingomonas sp. 3-13AW]|uniref:hypothetical protein n=1 Tax=Sphingomonas sp. 3-13AW TaxID=3050450 RepID=UPI003BB5B5E2
MPRTTLPRDTTLNLYVPKADGSCGVAKGSAIVGLPCADTGRIEVYYEGAVHGQKMSFEDKIQHAAGRLIDRAPIVAFGFYDADEFVLVGQVARSERLFGWVVTEITDPSALEAWAGEPVTVGGSAEMRQRAAGIAWPRLSPAKKIQIQIEAQAGKNITDLVLDAR